MPAVLVTQNSPFSLTTITGTYWAYPRRDGQAELAWMAACLARWFTLALTGLDIEELCWLRPTRFTVMLKLPVAIFALLPAVLVIHHVKSFFFCLTGSFGRSQWGKLSFWVYIENLSEILWKFFYRQDAIPNNPGNNVKTLTAMVRSY